jgi:RNA polymerase sigma factor (sigma-70 family)
MNLQIVKWIKIVVLRTLREKNLTRLDTSTLISAGMMGYVQALKRFDADRGVKFKTFAEYRIKGAVLDEVRKMIGDERCKIPRPRKVDDFDFSALTDSGRTQANVESGLDLEAFMENVDLDPRELEILRCRVLGMNLREIATKFEFSESRASQLLAKIKRIVYLWYKDEMGLKFKLVAMNCPACQGENCLADRVIAFRCDFCDAELRIDSGVPIVVEQGNEDGESDEIGYERTRIAT